MAEPTRRRRRRRSPLQAIIDFFMAAPIPEAQQALDIAGTIVENRAAQKPVRRGPRAAPVAAATAPEAPAPDPPPAAPKAPPTPRRARKGAVGESTPRRRRATATTPAGQATGSSDGQPQPRRRRPAVTGPVAAASTETTDPPPLPDQDLPGDDNPGETE